MCKIAAILLVNLVLAIGANASEKIVLDGKLLKERKEVFSIIDKEISFPKNAEKDFEVLSEILATGVDTPQLIMIKNLNLMKIRFGKKFSNELLESIMLASDVNKKIILVVE